MFKKEKTAHEFAEDTSIKKLLDGGFFKIDESKYEYNRSCCCKRCLLNTKARQELQASRGW